MENVVKPGAGPIMHVHHFQEEGATVEQGRIGYQRLGEPARFAGPGEVVTFRAGVYRQRLAGFFWALLPMMPAARIMPLHSPWPFRIGAKSG